MALTKGLSSFPGSQTFTAIYNSIPGSPLVKNIVAAGLAIGVAVLGGAALVAGGIAVKAGLIALGGALTWFLGSGLLVQVGVLLGLGALFTGVRFAVGFAYTFDWNISDTAIENAARAALDNLYQPLGEATGKTLGWLVCGFAPNVLNFVFAPATAVLIQRDMGKEFWQEIQPLIQGVAGTAATSAGNAKALKAYGSVRKWIKRPGTPFHSFFKKMLGKNFASWGTQEDKPFVITKKIDEKIDKIEDKQVKAFLEGAKEGFEEGCQEANLIITNGISEQIAAMRLAQNSSGGIVAVSI